jgi:lysophospholipase L1-like esterase
MPYTTIVTDAFTRANTSTVAGANSTTGVGNGWKDYPGSNANISSNRLQLNANPNDWLANACYWTGTNASFQTGRVTFDVISGEGAGIARFNPTDGSGWSVLFHGTQAFFRRCLPGGSGTNENVADLPAFTPATNMTGVVTVVDVGSTVVLTLTVYDTSNLATPLTTVSYTDNSGQATQLQRAGYWGVGCFGTTYLDNVTIEKAAVAITAGRMQLNALGRTAVLVYNEDASAGSGSGYTYQVQRSATSSSTGYSNVGSAAQSQLDTGLTANTNYWYRTLITDSVGTTAYSEVIAVTTVPSTGLVYGCIGDSITQGAYSRWDNAPPYLMSQLLNAAGRPSGFYNQGVPGSKSSDWVNTYLSIFIPRALSLGCDVIQIMLGTNDVDNSVSAATYKTNIASIIASLKAAGFRKIVLHESPYLAAVGFNNASTTETVTTANNLLLAYQTKLDELVDNVTVFRGSTGTWDYYQANQDMLTDGVHMTEDGQTPLATQWAIAETAATVSSTSGGSRSLSIGL